MATKRLPMRQIREILRLKHDQQLSHRAIASACRVGLGGVLVQIAKGLGDNGIWRIRKLNGILYLPDVGSKTTSFSSAFAGIFASN